MKKKHILSGLFATFCACTLAFTVSGIKTVSADDGGESGDNKYWESVFDVETLDGGTVEFTSEKTAPDYLKNGIYSRKMKDSGYSTGRNPAGVGIHFNKETTLTYKNPVYIKGLDKLDTLLEFYVNPVTQAYTEAGDESPASDSEFSKITVTLIDDTDSENWISIVVNRSTYDVSNSWAGVESPTMKYAGWHQKDKKLMTQVNRGAPLAGNFNGKGGDSIAVSYDYIENTVFANRALYASTEYDNKDLAVVRRLDDAAMMGPTDSVFKGFNGNFATMKITFSGIYDGEAGANVILMNLLNHKLDGKAVTDTESPKVVTPTGYNTEELPKGENNAFYPFLNFVGYDAVDGIISDKLEFKVIAPNGSEVPVDTKRGGFTPTETGDYTITVNLTDESGNKAEEKSVTVEIVPFIEAISLDFSSDVKSNLKIGETVALKIGETVALPKYEVIGGSGTVNVTRKVVCNNLSEELDIVNNSFIASAEGVYSVYYIATDYLNNTKTYEFKAIVRSTLAPTIGEAVVPKAVKKNNKLILNAPKSYDYSSLGTKTEVETLTYVSLSGTFDDKVLIENGYYLPASNVEKVYVRFEAKALVGTTDEYLAESEVYEVKVLDAETFADLMIKENIGVDFRLVSEYASNKEAFFYPTKKGASMQYVNAVTAKAFSIKLNVPASSQRFKEISVKLVDTVDAGESVTFVLTPNNEKYTNIATGFDAGKIGGVIYGASEESSVKFQIKANSVYDGDNHLVTPITRFDNGAAFNGFTSGRCYVKVSFDNFEYSGEDYPEVRITDFVSLPSFTELDPDTNDTVAPVISLDEHISLYHSCYSDAVIPSAKADDMISPECEVTVTVQSPSGSYILGAAGSGVSAATKHVITLSEYGSYKVIYQSRDEAGKRTQVQYIINSTDSVDPVLEINGQIKTKAKVGDELYIPDYKVSDNLTAAENIRSYVYIETPNYGLKTVSVSGIKFSYKFKTAGKYTLAFYAQDGSGNYVIKQFTIIVSE